MNTLLKTGIGSTLATLAVAALGSLASPASAVSLTWNLQNVQFEDGGTATGSFQYDADTNTFGAVNIQVQGGDTGTFPTYTYDTFAFLDPTFRVAFANSSDLDPNDSGVRQLRLGTASPLTNAGGTFSLQLNLPGSNLECFNCNPIRFITGGSLTTNPLNPAPVPEPGTILGLLAFGSLGVLSRKSKV
ncbi:PEP-CTERM sorting domain-containing protein [Crocosphaera sp. XPORK-15E]|uniref:PEP-CTERM sorting domain-containing protein n=1 Tax=Crocosphaera sp. XPORK-15E TaxID=3110247 RepID=UPI002B21D771|nr:PEP-CTERM sorting domain-containing protein [Crocosphaera sp. XPORK-15E]MEA5535634.1 PEP-CTERM sorting domain-containing protein [Crocosphaera sp. XPORK-15E]